MAYEYSENTLERWEFPAQAETYRRLFLHERGRAAYWRHRAQLAEALHTGSTIKPSGKEPKL